MKKVVAMYEREEEYGKRLAEYVNRREGVPFEIQLFSEPDKLSEYLQNRTPELLLLSEGGDIGYGTAKRVMYLTDQKTTNDSTDSIYKYQPTDRILHQLMQKLNCDDEKGRFASTGSGTVYGIYSPTGRCGKTTFSLILGESLSKKCSVIYIGFEELRLYYDSFENSEKSESGSLSDVYFYNRRHCLKEHIHGLVSHWHGLDIISGVNCPEDMHGIQISEWEDMVCAVAGLYDAVVLDMGTKLWLAASMFNICSHIYVPVLDDGYSQKLQKHFGEWFDGTQEGSLKEKMRTVKLPMQSQASTPDSSLEYALWGETGDYVRSIIN